MNTQSALLMTQHHAPQTRCGHCPTCGQQTHFSFLGEQRWSQRLVEATGCPPVTYLWTCENCHTTVSDADIES